MDKNIFAPDSLHRHIIILIIFLSALVVKFLVFYLITDPIIFVKYPHFAQQIAAGKNIGERLLDLSPFYLLINRLSFYIYAQNWEALVILQIIIGSLNCIVVYLIGEKIFGRKTGFLAAILLLLYGNLTLIDLTLEPEAILIFLNSLLILLLINIEESNSHLKSWLWLSAGLLTGLSVITKPNSLLVLIGILIWICFIRREKLSRFRSTFLLLIGVIIAVAPVTARNFLIFHDFVLVTADGGKVFYHGNGPEANGMERADLPHQGFIEESSDEPDYAHTLFRKTARAISGKDLKPSACSAFWVGQTLAHIRSDFPAWLYLELKKFGLFWHSYEVHDIDSNYKYYVTLKKFPLLNFGIIAVLGILGIVLSRKKFRDAFLLYWMILTYLSTVLVFFASSRYRIPAAPFLAVFSAFFMTYAASLWKEKKIRTLLIIFSIFIALSIAIHLPWQNELARFDRWQKATRIHYILGGKFLYNKGLYLQSIAELQKAIDLEPNFVPAYNLMGKCYALTNNYHLAEKYFQKVIELSPQIDEGYINLGLLYGLTGNDSKARLYLEKALAINPQNEKTRIRLQKQR